MERGGEPGKGRGLWFQEDISLSWMSLQQEVSALTLPGRGGVDGGGAAHHPRGHGAAAAVVWGGRPGEALSRQLLPLLVLHLLQLLAGLHLGLLLALLTHLLPEKEEDQRETHQSLNQEQQTKTGLTFPHCLC